MAHGATPKLYLRHREPFNERTSLIIRLTGIPRRIFSSKTAAMSMPHVCNTSSRHFATIALWFRKFAPFVSMMLAHSSDIIFIVFMSRSARTSQHPIYIRSKEEEIDTTSKKRIHNNIEICNNFDLWWITIASISCIRFDVIIVAAKHHRLEHFGPEHRETPDHDHNDDHCLFGPDVGPKEFVIVRGERCAIASGAHPFIHRRTISIVARSLCTSYWWCRVRVLAVRRRRFAASGKLGWRKIESMTTYDQRQLAMRAFVGFYCIRI